MSPSRIRFALCCFAVSMALSPLCAAHEVIPPDWCLQDQHEPKIVARFDMDGKELRGFLAKCGIVEKDKWRGATKGAIEYCKLAAPKDNAVPFVFGPDSYLSPDHHSLYDLDEGISGACAVCAPRTQRGDEAAAPGR